MRRGSVACAALTLAVFVGGCAGTSVVNVGYDEAEAARGPLSVVGVRRIRIQVTDGRRESGELIAHGTPGWFVFQRKDILLQRPAGEIVRDALAAELRKNGHVVVADGADRVLMVDIREFGLESSGDEAYAIAAITVAVADGRGGHVLLTRHYLGLISRQRDRLSGAAPNLERIMNDALKGMLRDVATDPRLGEALKPL